MSMTSINTCRHSGTRCTVETHRRRAQQRGGRDVARSSARHHGADSAVDYSAVSPVAGVTFRASQAVNVYASYGKGFETPTLNDLAYRSTTGDPPASILR